VLFVVWAMATIVWVASALDSLANGDAIPTVTAVGAVALMVLLACMEGLEVSVIDRWQTVWPGVSTNYLAGWLAARQLFVALIVTAASPETAKQQANDEHSHAAIWRQLRAGDNPQRTAEGGAPDKAA
jgi:predicted acyltransferase